MKRVIIESPFRGRGYENLQDNINYLHLCRADCFLRGEAYFASHGFYTLDLDDSDAAERAFGIAAGQAWASVADLIAVYIDKGISKGMKSSIKIFLEWGMEIEFRALDQESFMLLPVEDKKFIREVQDIVIASKVPPLEQINLL
jgi:hypothetical protein